VPGHFGVEGNEMADALAKRAIHSEFLVMRRKLPRPTTFWEHALLECRIDIPSLDLTY